MKIMLLAIDIGNSNTVVGVFDNGLLANHFRVTSNHDLTVDECGFFITGLLEKLNVESRQIDRVVIASVVPRLSPIYAQMCRKYLKTEPLLVSSKIKLPIKIGYDNPEAVGADRIANAVAAYEKYRCAIIVVDFGTATTFDVIDGNGQYLGGIIAPGPETAGADLARRAAKLFEVTIEKPKTAIGRNTADSIKSGLFYGTVGMVDSLIERILKELNTEARIIATGGLAGDFAAQSRYIEETAPELTLEGLKLIADYQ